MPVKFVGKRKPITPKDTAVVRCEIHDVVTTWGALDGIQQLAVQEGLDVGPELPCLLAPKSP